METIPQTKFVLTNFFSFRIFYIWLLIHQFVSLSQEQVLLKQKSDQPQFSEHEAQVRI